MARLPAAYIPRLYDRPPVRPDDGMTVGALDALLDELAGENVHSPAAASLVDGRLAIGPARRTALFVLGDVRVSAIAAWARCLSTSRYTSVAGCWCGETGRPDRLCRRDMPLLTGHGVVIASRGVTGRPLAGLPLEELRRELADSRRQLSEWAGYPVRILMPRPTTFGQASDGLVVREARRAGYRVILCPGRSITDLDAGGRPSASNRLFRLQYRTIRTTDSPTHLRDWVVGSGLARPVAHLRELVNRPRRILSRFNNPNSR